MSKRNTLNHKRPIFWIVIFSILVLAAAVTSLGFKQSAIKENKNHGKEIQVSTEKLKNKDFDLEKNLEIIMSSPKTSSNPQDYINEHPKEYEEVVKHGGDNALNYMLSQFKQGNSKGLRGQIMMRLCKELLGPENKVKNDSLSPQEWYNYFTM